MKLSKIMLFLALLATTGLNAQTTQNEAKLKILKVQVECECWVFLEYKKDIELSTDWELIVGLDDAPAVEAYETVEFNIINSGYYKVTSAPTDTFNKGAEIIIKIDIDNGDIIEKKIECKF